jgi:hypothetical protein
MRFKLKSIANPFAPPPLKDRNATEYYKKYFSDRIRLTDGMKKEDVREIVEGKVSDEVDESDKKRLRSPNQYWAIKNFVTPSPEAISSISKGSDLVVTMINELKLVHKRGERNEEVWQAFAKQVIYLLNSSTEKEAQCSSRLALRTLEVFGSLQIYDQRLFNTLLGFLEKRFDTMKTREFFYVIQAMARMRLHEHRVLEKIMRLCSLCWPTLIPKHLVKVSNACAKLGVEGPWKEPLQATLRKAVSTGRLKGQELALLKGVTVISFLDALSTIDYFVYAAENRASFDHYPENLLLVELYARLCKDEEIWSKVPDSVKEFLAEMRTKSKHFQAEERESSVSEKTRNGKSDFADEVREILLAKKVAVFFEDQACGPYKLDFFFPAENTVVELSPSFQFYNCSSSKPKLTAPARLRQELLRAMGFRVLVIPHYLWKGSKAEKTRFLEKNVLDLLSKNVS